MPNSGGQFIARCGESYKHRCVCINFRVIQENWKTVRIIFNMFVWFVLAPCTELKQPDNEIIYTNRNFGNAF